MTNPMENLLQLIDNKLDDITKNYLVAVIQNLNTEDPAYQFSVVKEAIEPFLVQAGLSHEEISRVCTSLAPMVEVSANFGLMALEVPTSMQSFHEEKASTSSISIDLIQGRSSLTPAELDKKGKQELKQKMKQDKKDKKEAAKKTSNYVANEMEVDPEEYFASMEEKSRSRSRDIKIENFDISIAGKKIVTEANLLLSHGRRYGLIGRNGIGKSTLLRNLAMRVLPVPKNISILHVEQEVIGDDTSAIDSVLRADKLRSYLLDQEKFCLEALKDKNDEAIEKKLSKVYHQMAELDCDKAESIASMILSGLGFSIEDQKKPTKQFSGGWRMRISLARALFCKPDLLLLDEPTNMLDLPSIMWLQNYFSNWKKTILVVSHDRTFLDEITTDILHLHHETLDVYKGNYTQFLTTREEKLKNYQKEYENQMQYREHLQAFIDKFRYNAARAAQAQSKIKILEKLPVLKPIPTEPTIRFTFPVVEAIPSPAIRLNNCSFGYTPEKILLKDVDFSMELTSRVGIVGPNGVGKTTFLKLLTGLLEPLTGHRQAQSRLRFAFFSQHHVDQLDLSMNSIEFMSHKFPGKTEEEYRRHLGSFGVSGPLATQKIGTLSGGQKSRVVFAALNMQNPHILILDEPTNHLDMDTIDALIKGLGAFNGGLIVVSHDQKFVTNACDEILICNNQTVKRFDGGIKEYIETLTVPTLNL